MSEMLELVEAKPLTWASDKRKLRVVATHGRMRNRTLALKIRPTYPYWRVRAFGSQQTKNKMILKPPHPFPARMAPELALQSLQRLPKSSVVLDPMMGSGTVVRHAIELGHTARGFDLDPLAVLMTTVWTRPVSGAKVELQAKRVIDRCKKTALTGLVLPWIDRDKETLEFTKFWFARPQRNDLRRLSFVLNELYAEAKNTENRAVLDVLRLGLSRIIITKDRGASLARDVSHSRPHRVETESDFDVFSGFSRAVAQILKVLAASPLSRSARISQGDARDMKSVRKASIDAVFTSPPYLNQIDYMRGHRMSLVWLGHSLGGLRSIRSNSIGSERSPDSKDRSDRLSQISAAMTDIENLSPRFAGMVNRYAGDISDLLDEIARVIKPGGTAVFVVGNSNLKGSYINNAEGVSRAAVSAGFTLVHQNERELPTANRYLPIPLANHTPLGKRMRTETVMTFSA